MTEIVGCFDHKSKPNPTLIHSFDFFWKPWEKIDQIGHFDWKKGRQSQRQRWMGMKLRGKGWKVVNYMVYQDPALVNGAGMIKRMMKGRGEKLKWGGGCVFKMPSISSKWLLGVLSGFHIKMIKVSLKTKSWWSCSRWEARKKGFLW